MLGSSTYGNPHSVIKDVGPQQTIFIAVLLTYFRHYEISGPGWRLCLKGSKYGRATHFGISSPIRIPPLSYLECLGHGTVIDRNPA